MDPDSNYVNYRNSLSIQKAYSTHKSIGAFSPAVYVVEITNRCSLSCIMCPRKDIESRNIGDMDLELFRKICNLISPYCEHLMLYFMGEPLMHRQFSDIVRIARTKIKGKISISTNALFLNKKKRSVLIDLSIDLIICCIDHWNKLEYASIRIGGDYETAFKNTQKLLEESKSTKPFVIVKSLDFGMKKEDHDKYLDYWSSKGGVPTIGWVDSWAGQMPELLKLSSSLPPYINKIRKSCADLWFKMIINWKGEIVLCCHDFNYATKLGQIDQKEKDISKIWQSNLMGELRDKHIHGNFCDLDLCKSCNEWGEIDELSIYRELSKDKLSLIF
jgi:hypothetical protein